MNRNFAGSTTVFSILRFGLTIWIMVLIMVCFITSCTSVKPYQKMYLDDPDMELKARIIEAYEISCESYREGSAGAHGGKSGGGCGCF